jgi:hypothetical protein
MYESILDQLVLDRLVPDQLVPSLPVMVLLYTGDCIEMDGTG